MIQTLDLGGFSVDVVRKDIKNVHLSVHPPTGRVRIAAPKAMSFESIRLFAIAKINWIRRHQCKLQAQDREPPREYLSREGHYVWGRRVLLKLEETQASPEVELRHTTLVVRVRDISAVAIKEASVARWYRQQLKSEIPALIELWAPRLGVRVNGFFVQQMKTKWGSCNPRAGTIRLNTELAKKPRGCLEYVVVHELAHLVDPRHGKRFVATMDRFMPHWREIREMLNRLPVRLEHWRERRPARRSKCPGQRRDVSGGSGSWSRRSSDARTRSKGV
jgi:predicted metal-dependent hydrolase